MASQMGVSQATGPLGDLSKGVQDMASMLGGQVSTAPSRCKSVSLLCYTCLLALPYHMPCGVTGCCVSVCAAWHVVLTLCQRSLRQCCYLQSKCGLPTPCPVHLLNSCALCCWHAVLCCAPLCRPLVLWRSQSKVWLTRWLPGWVWGMSW